ncbi:internal scaffolding protein [Sigmofec virus UA08Rod_6110]|uniref:Internal scaffolding protein n=1 Tax=Sigmofec virus UA08Rod_6110 TaxID=2929452 RepID=A0A976N0D9_9VIRU|nr:internal scaffolding protein [Sigmofec virus UA08Rod_6110]
MQIGTVQRDSSQFYKRFLPDNINRAKTSIKDIIAYNPVCTDETMRGQTDLHALFSQHPDISGLSLLLDDEQRQQALDTVQFEDFMEPQDHYDIFDLYQFVEQAKSSFRSLPIQFRMQYNNDPLNFISQFNDPATSSKVLASLSETLNRPVPTDMHLQSGETSAPASTSSDIPKSPDTSQNNSDKTS